MHHPTSMNRIKIFSEAALNLQKYSNILVPLLHLAFMRMIHFIGLVVTRSHFVATIHRKINDINYEEGQVRDQRKSWSYEVVILLQ